MIKIEITGNNLLEALANITAYGMLCMENREVFDAAGAILVAAREKQQAPTTTADPPVQEPVVPPTMPPATAPTAPISQSQAGSAVGASPGSTTPSNPVPTAVPTSPAPAFTLEQISKAGAELISRDPNLRDTLMGLLKDQGVESVQQLSPDQYGTYATALRGLGARI